MAELGNNRFGSSPFTPEAAPAAPPPPPEVKVRTMRSDLAAMAKSGGGVPRFENVKIEGLAEARAAARATAKPPEMRRASRSWGLVAAIVALILLGVAGYLVYTTFFAASGAPAAVSPPAARTPSSTAANTGGNNGATGPTAGSAATVPAAASSTSATALFTHQSLFKKSADQVLTLTINTSGSATTAADLETFNQKLETLFATANKTATLIEVDVKDASGRSVSIENIFAAANETVVDPTALAAHFNPDATFFVYRDANGFWPGYVLALRSGDNWLFSSADVAKLETSPSIANFFLQNVGAPSSGGFTDSTVSGVTVRILPYLNIPTPAYFVYGWTKGDLILSTSQPGFGQAVSRL